MRRWTDEMYTYDSWIHKMTAHTGILCVISSGRGATNCRRICVQPTGQRDISKLKVDFSPFDISILDFKDTCCCRGEVLCCVHLDGFLDHGPLHANCRICCGVDGTLRRFGLRRHRAPHSLQTTNLKGCEDLCEEKNQHRLEDGQERKRWCVCPY